MKHVQMGLFDNIEDLGKRRRKKHQHDAETLERLAKRAGLPADVAAELAMNLRPAPQADWIFLMISPQQNAAVVQWLEEHSKRPMKAMKLWAELLTCLRADTGEILRSRDELAERVGMTPRHLSNIMSELASINAIVRQREGRRVRYFLNPNIATHIPSPEDRKKAREGAGPLLVLMEGGQANA